MRSAFNPSSIGGFMSDLTPQILSAITRPSYTPIKPKQLCQRMGLSDSEYPAFRRCLRQLIRDGRVLIDKQNTLRAAEPFATVIGIYRRTSNGTGFVRPHTITGETGPEIRIRSGKDRDASPGDEVLVRVTRRATRTGGSSGDIVQVTKRATRTFVGTYFERGGQAYVRVDGTVFAHSIWVGDPGVKGAKPQDKVVIEMLRFPSAEERGEGVITEVLGPLGQPGVDTLSILKAYELPEAFPAAVLEEAQQRAEEFRESDLTGREDFTTELVITIDPKDARDFDDAVSVAIDPKTRHWILSVHIADVGHFARPGSALDSEARKRATSVYLPQKVIPMFPELISNGLASLQQDRVRYVKTVRMEWTPGLQKGHVSFHNAAIRVRRRFTYEEVRAILQQFETGETVDLPPELAIMLRRMRDLALLLRKKRFKRGSLELSMPEAVLEYDAEGRVTGAHFAEHDLSHQIIEEFMLAANEAVAEHLTRLDIPFLRRVHPAPNEEKLAAFGQFATLLGYPIERPDNRFALQQLLLETAEKPERAAIHYALLRSLKQAAYSPIQDEHYALASQHYCHFTSPIRRYPDLQVHRQLDRWLRTGHASAKIEELVALGDHCSKMERRAEAAERELIKLKLLQYLSTRLGEKLDAVITGVADYGFFAQGVQFPAEGLIHVSSLTDDFYQFDQDAHTLYGTRTRRRFRLGDRVRVIVARVDLQRRMLDFRLAPDQPEPARRQSGSPDDPASRQGKRAPLRKKKPKSRPAPTDPGEKAKSSKKRKKSKELP
jgi:ribonuclease R